MSEAAELGVAGLGAMGRNLALQASEKGLAVAVYDPWSEARAAWDASSQKGSAAVEVATFAQSLSRPRRILLLVKAGEPTDALIQSLRPHLAPGDIVADLGNAHYLDTERRQQALAQDGIHFLGIGISGGAEGARGGASFMAGGDRQAWELLAPAVDFLSARAEGHPCSGWFGSGGAGHYVKMVHNGIEYAEMQALAEVYMALRDVNGLNPAAIAEQFDLWNRDIGQSFLTGLSAQVLRTPSGAGGALIDDVLDDAGQKGTGRWTAEAALDLGVPAPTLAEAVFARNLSALGEERRTAAAALSGPQRSEPIAAEALGQALLGTRISAFAQGFALLEAASEQFGWEMDLAEVAEVWRAGCILRSALLPHIAEAFRGDQTAVNLIAAPAITSILGEVQQPWRQAVASCQEAGLPIPALSSALAYYDGWRSPRLGTNLTAAQRDAFGYHGYRRIGEAGTFHSVWATHGKAEE